MILIKGHWTLNGSKKWHEHRRRFKDQASYDNYKKLAQSQYKCEVIFYIKREIPGKVRDHIIADFMHNTPTLAKLALKYGVSRHYITNILSNYLTKA